MKIIGSVYEHDAIFRYLDLYVHDIGELERVLQMYPEEDKIVYWMMVNNISGQVFNVEEIGSLCHKYGAYYIMDAVAAIGHYPISDNFESFCDCLITSGHKYRAEKGLGFMWLSDRFSKFLGLSDDSYAEFGLLHGTTNVPGAIALSYAMEHAIKWEQQDRATQTLHYYNLFTHLAAKLAENRIEFEVVESKDNPKATCAINAIVFPGINADALTNFLSIHNIYISPGHSACSNDIVEASRILEAFGLTKQEASQTVRVSFGESTTQEDIDALVNGIVEFKNLFI